MSSTHNKTKEDKKPFSIPTVSAVLDDGAILEMVHASRERRTAFVLWRAGQWRFESGLSDGPFRRLVPYPNG